MFTLFPNIETYETTFHIIECHGDELKEVFEKVDVFRLLGCFYEKDVQIINIPENIRMKTRSLSYKNHF